MEGKSMRTTRMESGVNGSRQKGHTGERRGLVFSAMVCTQGAQRTWPGEGGIISKSF